jgi:hypothetical protein
MAKNERRGRTGTERSTSNDDGARIDKALESAARWLKRRGARREKRATRQAYTEAASVIMNRLHR